MTIVVVAEKPSVGRDLAAVLGATVRGDGLLRGNGYVVTWAIGHLVGLAEPAGINPDWKGWNRAQLPMLPARWPLAVLDSSRAQFAVVRKALTAPDVTSVVCATDAGREGELIFRFIYEASGCRRPVQRLWISSLTDGAIREGFRTLKPAAAYDRLAHAALGRARADWLVGMNLSRAYGLALDGPISVGRVQTPTLAMLVERELQIRDFVPEDYLEVHATFSPREGATYKGTWFDEKRTRLPPDGVEATAIVARVKAGKAKIESIASQTRRLPPPLLYDLTELQRHANRLYGFSAQHTLELAQALYERHKLLSYPRTDSRHLSTEVSQTLGPIVQAIRAPYESLLAPGTGARALSGRFVDDARVGDHHAIIPTAVSPSGRTLTEPEKKVYALVCRRLLQAWHPDFVWDATTVVTAVDARDRFKSQGTAVRQMGWKVLDFGNPDDAPTLPSGLAQGQPQRVVDVAAVAKKTKPPPRLTDATLLTAMEHAGKQVDETRARRDTAGVPERASHDKELSAAMKDCGLGTPATRASIIETLLTRGYAAREGKTLIATERGVELIAVVDAEVKSPAMTGDWEAGLARIARGEGDLASFQQRVEAYVAAVVGRVPPRFPPRSSAQPSPAERTLLESIRARVFRTPGVAAGTVRRDLFGEDAAARPRFERLLAGLVNAGHVRAQAETFMKDGKPVPYQRLFPSNGTGEVTLPPERTRAPRRWRRRGATSRSRRRGAGSARSG